MTQTMAKLKDVDFKQSRKLKKVYRKGILERNMNNNR
jgi:hypothetical protein